MQASAIVGLDRKNRTVYVSSSSGEDLCDTEIAKFFDLCDGSWRIIHVGVPSEHVRDRGESKRQSAVRAG